MEKAAYFNCYG